MRTIVLITPIALLLAGGVAQSADGDRAPATAVPGKALDVVLVPKALGATPPTDRIGRLFEQAHQGAQQAAKELRNPKKLQYGGLATGQLFPLDCAGHSVALDALQRDDMLPAAIVEQRDPFARAQPQHGSDLVGQLAIFEQHIAAVNCVGIHEEAIGDCGNADHQNHQSDAGPYRAPHKLALIL